MNKLSYGNFDSTNTDIAFDATSGYTEPSSELERRKQLSYPLKEVKTFVNNTVPVLKNNDDETTAIQLVVESNSLKYRTEPKGALSDVNVAGKVPTGGSTNQYLKKNSGSNYDLGWATLPTNLPVTYQTSAPSANYTGGGLKVAYLTSNPSTKYTGWIYLIKE